MFIKAADVIVGDLIEITKVGRGGEHWNLRKGATGKVIKVRDWCLTVLWDDPALNGPTGEPTILMPGLDRWRILTPATG